MFSYIRGTIHTISLDSLLVITQAGLGFEIRVGKKALSQKQVGDTVDLFTQVYSRDDYFEVYGFLTQEELQLFELLTSISGVGPKMALGVLGEHTVTEIQEAILSEDTHTFTAISGIGKKNASRIILELKPKMGGEASLSHLTEGESNNDLVQALRALGYSEKEVQHMIQHIDHDTSLDEQVKQALSAKV